MIRVFRMEWYRMWKNPAVWILFLAYCALFALAGGVMGILVGDSSLSQRFQQEFYGAPLTLDGGVLTDYAELFNACMMGNIVMLVTSVCIGIHATGHVVSGYQKNLAGVAKKWHYAVSSLVLLFVFNAILIVLGAFVLRIVMFLTHETVTCSSFVLLLRYCGVYLLLSTAYGMFGAVLALLTQSRIVAIIVPVVYCTTASGLFYMLLDAIAGALNFQIESVWYFPCGSLRSLRLTDSATEYGKAIFGAVLCIALCILLSVTVGRKRDMR